MYKALKVGLLALALALFIDILFYKQLVGLNVPLASLAFLGTTYGAMFIGGHKLPVRAHVTAVFSLLFSIPFAIGTAEQMLVLSTVGFLSSHLLFAAFAIGQEAHFNHPLQILWNGTADLGIKLLSHLDFLGKLKPPTLSQKNWAVGKGLLMLVPLLIIFVSLFASADPIFKSYFGEIGDWFGTWTNLADLTAQLFIIGFLFLGLAPFLGTAAIDRVAHEPRKERAEHLMTESKVILAGLAILFALFLILQGSVMFGGSAAFERIDMTYAEYARQGFDQLIFVSVLVAAIVLTLRDQHGSKGDAVLTLLHGALIVETLLVLVSAAMRLSMYIDAYGYTDARLFAYWTISTIGIMLILLLANVVQRESQTILMNRSLIVLGVCALLFCYSMPDATAARLNFRRADDGKKIDFISLTQLSPEAKPVIVDALQQPYTFSDVPASFVASWLTKDSDQTNDVRSWNYSRMRADDVLPARIPDWLEAAVEPAESSSVTGLDSSDRPR
jgi:hypothetical protein